MGYSRYIGRVGALAVALGVGVAVASAPGVAGADDSTTAAGSSASADSKPTKAQQDSDNQRASTDDPAGDTGDDADGPARTSTTATTIGTGSQPATTVGGAGSPEVTVSGSTVTTSERNDGESEETAQAGADEADTTGVSAAPTAGADPAPSATPPVEPASSTPPPAAPSETIAAPIVVRPTLGETPPPSGPAPRRNSGQAPPAGHSVAASRVGQRTAGSLDTTQRSVAPGAPTSSPSRPVNADLTATAATGEHLIAARGPQPARTTALPSAQDPVEQPATVASVAKTVVAALLSPLVAPGPLAPVESPVVWAMLGWTRRETQRSTVTPPSTVTPQETTLVADTVGEPLALTAGVPTAAATTTDLPRRNVAPIALPDLYSTTEDTARTVTGRGVLGNDIDLNGDPLTAALVSGPKNGTVTLNPTGSFLYTPKANYSGADSFTYRASDGTTTSNVGTVVVNVTAVNDPPVATPDTYSTATGVKLTVAAAAGVLTNDVDPDGPVRQAQLVSRPSNGTLELNANGSFTYKPRANYSGTDTFTYRAFDGKTTSAPATVSITVGNPNTAPVATNDGPVTVAEGSSTPITVLANDTDAQGNTTINPATVQVVTGPAHGSTSVNTTTGVITYTSNGAEVTADSFSYRVKDTSGAISNTATVSITITPVNDGPPAANPDAATVNEGGSTAITVLGNDTDPDGNDTINPATVEVVTGPASGTATPNANGTITYQSNGAEVTADTFTYRVKDTSGAVSNTATVNITITPVNDAPVASSDTITIPEDSLLAANLQNSSSDPDGDALTAVLVSGPAHAQIFTLNPNRTFNYAPVAHFSGPDSFTYKVNDGALDSNTVTVTINVTAVNNVPVASSDTITIPEDSSVAANLQNSSSDPDGDALTAILVSGPTHAQSFTLNPNRTFNYAPVANFSGQDSFTYKVNDGALDSNTVTVTINVTAVNDAPAITSLTPGTVNQATGAISYSLAATDESTPPANLIVTVTQPADTTGAVSTPIYNQNTGKWEFNYTPDPRERLDAYSSTETVERDEFTVAVSDGESTTATPVSAPIDPAEAVLTHTISVGNNPAWVAVSPDGTRAYVTNLFAGTVSVINTATDTVIDTDPVAAGVNPIVVGGAPWDVSVSPDGTRLYITKQNDHTVSVIDTATYTVIDTDPIAPGINPIAVGGQPWGVAVTPNGDRVYVTNRLGNAVSVINTATNTVVDTDPIAAGVNPIPVGNGPSHVVVSPNGARVYVTNRLDGTVSVIDTATNTVVDTDPVAPGVNPITVGDSPLAVAVSPNGTRVYVTRLGGWVSVIDTATNTPIDTDPIAAGANPIVVGGILVGVAVSPDGTRVYVTDQGGDTVSVIDSATNRVVERVPGIDGANGVAVHPAGDRIYVTSVNTNTVVVITSV